MILSYVNCIKSYVPCLTIHSVNGYSGVVLDIWYSNVSIQVHFCENISKHLAHTPYLQACTKCSPLLTTFAIS